MGRGGWAERGEGVREGAKVIQMAHDMVGVCCEVAAVGTEGEREAAETRGVLRSCTDSTDSVKLSETHVTQSQSTSQQRQQQALLFRQPKHR